MSLKICREADISTTPCAVNIPIMEKYRLPKVPCNYNSDFATPGMCLFSPAIYNNINLKSFGPWESTRLMKNFVP
jgi:hypothetical protein